MPEWITAAPIVIPIWIVALAATVVLTARAIWYFKTIAAANGKGEAPALPPGVGAFRSADRLLLQQAAEGVARGEEQRRRLADSIEDGFRELMEEEKRQTAILEALVNTYGDLRTEVARIRARGEGER